MSKFYSKSTRGFYSVEAHGKDGVPSDAIEISDDEWLALLNEQSNGKQIVPGTHGGPVAVDPDPGPGLLVQRENALRETDWLIARHRDEMELDEHQTTLSAEQYSALQSWRRDLRNLTTHPDFPRIKLPLCPV